MRRLKIGVTFLILAQYACNSLSAPLSPAPSLPPPSTSLGPSPSPIVEIATPLLEPTATAVATATLEPSPTAPPELLALEIIEWGEYPYANLADPANTDTRVEVLIRNPNDVPVRLDRDNEELRFLNAAGETAYANPNPFLYIWEGEWMLPGETAPLSACVCFWSSGLEKQPWEALEFSVPLEVASDIAYTLDVEVTLGEFFSLADAHLGGSGEGAEVTLTNTSDQVLESIPMRVLAHDADGKYVGVATFGNAVVSFTENISIQPGDTANGVLVNEIDYYTGPMTYEVNAIGILAEQ
jgi:hypothetical protein